MNLKKEIIEMVDSMQNQSNAIEDSFALSERQKKKLYIVLLSDVIDKCQELYEEIEINQYEEE